MSSTPERAQHSHVCNLSPWPSVQPFFEAMHRALKPGGVICTQVRVTSIFIYTLKDIVFAVLGTERLVEEVTMVSTSGG